MPEQSRTTLKTYFETADYPTQAQFVDLIDSHALVAEVALKANIASPVFTGTVTCNADLIVTTTITVGGVLLTPTGTELNFVDGVTSAIQTQIDTKAPSASPTFTGTVVLPATTSIDVVSATEIGFLNGVTSAIQTQLDAKQATLVSATNIKTVNGTTLLGAGDMVIGAGDAMTANALSQFAATTSAQLAGVLSDETGTNVVVFNTNPTLVGFTKTGVEVVTATAMALLEIDVTKPLNTKSIVVPSTLTFSNLTPTAGTRTELKVTVDAADRLLTLPTAATIWSYARNADITTVTIPANTTMALSFEYTGARWEVYGDPVETTGTGAYVKATSPTLTTPDIGTPSAGVATNLTGTATGLTAGIAQGLKSATTTVSVSAAAAPTTGQVLRATSDSTATWQTAAGDVSKVSTPVNNQVGVWTGDGTLEGTTRLTYDPTTGLTIGIDGNLTRSIGLTLLNTSDTAIGSDQDDYIDEVHLVLQAGTTVDHRRYIDFKHYDGTDAWLIGVNAGNNFIWYDSAYGHRMLIESGLTTKISAVGVYAVEINNYPENGQGTGGLAVWSGGDVAGRVKVATIGESASLDSHFAGKIFWGGTDSTGAGRLNYSGINAYMDAQQDGGAVYLRANVGGVMTQRMLFDTDGSKLGKPSPATNATTDFSYIPACAGTPTGAPTAVTGMAPFVVDSTNNKFYIYIGGAWREQIASGVAASTSILSAGPTSGIGYATGAGGAVTQITDRTTGVTLNKVTGAITLVSAAGSATPASFVVNNSAVAIGDTVLVSQQTGTDTYMFSTRAAAGSFTLTSYTTGGTTTEQPVFNFVVVKGVAA